jgi:thioredoxin reductase (NADPH)
MYDLIIIGGGPAALAGAVYAARYKLNTLVIASHIGGQIAEAKDIENWPGIKNISGIKLMENFEDHARSLGVAIIQEEAKDIRKEELFIVNNKYQSRSLLLACGCEKRKLNIPGEKEFAGRGVSYCATCDAAFFRKKVVGVVGGSDAAAVAALIVAEFADKVYIIYRNDSIRAEPRWIDKIKANKKIEIITNTNVKEIKGNKTVSSVIFDNGKEFPLSGLFIEAGTVPSSSLAAQLKAKTDKEGYIIVDSAQRTNIKGVYAAGDATTGSNKFRQVITACAEAAVAVRSSWEDNKNEK